MPNLADHGSAFAAVPGFAPGGIVASDFGGRARPEIRYRSAAGFGSEPAALVP